MRILIACFCLILTPFLVAKKPNVILIFADDISARELPIYGSNQWTDNEGQTVRDPAFRAATPALSKIANEGVWLETSWSATVCAPSRAMLMTGRYASSHKWWHNRDFGMSTDEEGKEVIYPLYESSPNLIGHIAKKAGYDTFWAGKTQMWEADLTRFGFDEIVQTFHGANPFSTFRVTPRVVDGIRQFINHDTGNPVKTSYPQASVLFRPNVLLVNHPEAKQPKTWWPNTPESEADYGLNTYGPDVLQEFIFDFIERKHEEERPFFVYHTANLGHDNFDFLNPQSGEKWPGTPRLEWTDSGYKRLPTNITGSEGNYETHGTITEPGVHTHLEYLDYQVWRYLNKMRELGIEDNTILIFTSDNGTWGYGKGKEVKQRGTHVPFIVYAPGAHLSKVGRQNIISDLTDVLPTLAEVMGAELPDGLLGKSLWPYLTTDTSEHRDWIYSYKAGRQLVRGKHLLRDGNKKWWDTTRTPADLDSFQPIDDWESLPASYQAERQLLEQVLQSEDRYHTHHGPETR